MAEYIGREKIYADISRLLIDKNGADLTDCEDGWTSAISEAMDVIKNTPAADVRPERHSYYRTLIANTFMGRLDKDRNPIFQDRASYVCAECGRGTIVKDNFCSHCGAKMDGKENK